MKCLILYVLCLSSLFSHVYSLGLRIVSVDGYMGVVQWTRDDFDPDPLTFDLRFVLPPFDDVGLARANLSPDDLNFSGNVTVEFPGAGTYVVIAVTGLDNFELGRTTAIKIRSSASAIPLSSTSSPMPSPTSSSTPSPTPSPTSSPTLSPTPPPMPSQMPSQTPTHSPTSSSPSKSIVGENSSSTYSKQTPNLAAIVCGILGGVLLLALILLGVLHLYKRRLMPANRISFYGDRMVQRSSSGTPPSIRKAGQGGTIIPYPFTGSGFNSGSALPSSREARPLDVEQGLAAPPMNHGSRPSSPLPSGHIVPPPRGPRDRGRSIRFNESSFRPTRVDGEPTARQRRLADKVIEVDRQIEELKSQLKPPPSTIVHLDDLEMRRSWLIKQRDSMWAKEEIDSLPPGYARYMT